MSTLVSLKKLYKKMTGKDSHASVNSEAIAELDDAMPEGSYGRLVLKGIMSSYDDNSAVWMDGVKFSEFCAKYCGSDRDPVIHLYYWHDPDWSHPERYLVLRYIGYPTGYGDCFFGYDVPMYGSSTSAPTFAMLECSNSSCYIEKQLVPYQRHVIVLKTSAGDYKIKRAWNAGMTNEYFFSYPDEMVMTLSWVSGGGTLLLREEDPDNAGKWIYTPFHLMHSQYDKAIFANQTITDNGVLVRQLTLTNKNSSKMDYSEKLITV